MKHKETFLQFHARKEKERELLKREKEREILKLNTEYTPIIDRTSEEILNKEFKQTLQHIIELEKLNNKYNKGEINETI